MTTDTPSSRDEEIPTPRTDHFYAPLRLGETRSHEESVAYAQKLERDLIRLSAEREDLITRQKIASDLLEYDRKEIFLMKDTLAERDNQLADERLNYGAQVACIQGLENEVAMWKRRAEEKQKPVRALGENLEELTRQLLAAQTVNGKMREAFGPHEDPKLTRLGWVETLVRSIKKDPKVAELLSPYDSDALWECLGECEALVRDGQAALALSPDPTLLDEVVELAEMAEAESKFTLTKLGATVSTGGLIQLRDKAIALLSRLRQSTRETPPEPSSNQTDK